MSEFDLDALLKDVDGDVATELASMPEVVDRGDAFDVDSLPIKARKWHRVPDAVAVVADLKGSTRLGLGKRAASTASIYEAATGGVVQIFDEFDADFVAIQGDGAFALFWGEKRYERAVCAGITIRTFSDRHLVPRLEKKWQGEGQLPETGLKVGVASGRLLAKRVGVPRTDHQEPVWAGRAVNYAAKCAQQADRDQMIVTGSIWDWAGDNDYLAVSCGCGGDGTPSPAIWEDVVIEKIPEADDEREGKLCVTCWCETHGDEFCAAVMRGDRTRPAATQETKNAFEVEMSRLQRASAHRNRDEKARKAGLRRI